MQEWHSPFQMAVTKSENGWGIPLRANSKAPYSALSELDLAPQGLHSKALIKAL